MTLKHLGLSLLAALLLAGTAQASEKKSDSKKVEKGTEKEDTLGWRKPGPKHLQMSSIMAPVESADRRVRTSVPITIVIKVNNNEAVPQVCRLTARVNDAVIAEFYRKPIIYGADREMDTVEAGRRLKDPINRSLGADLVAEAFVVQGTKKMGSGSIGRLPFASVFGCRELKLDDNGKGKEGKEGKEGEEKKDGGKKH